MNFSIAHTTRHRVPRVPFLHMKNKMLSKKYALSVVFVSPKKIQELNKRYRKVSTSTDILSFSISKTAGELYISMPDVLRKATFFGMTPRMYLGYLFIHGCLHLEGHDHGRTMEVLERKFSRAFHFSTPL